MTGDVLDEVADDGERLATLPPGVELRKLAVHSDARGTLFEAYRHSRNKDEFTVQWVVVHGVANALRGVHVHRVHQDRIIPIVGRTLIGIQDLRSGTTDVGVAALLRLDAAEPHELIVPPGVAHGFYSEKPSSLLLGTSTEYDSRDDLGCAWNDPELRLPWDVRDPILSDRDARAGSLTLMIARLVE